MVINKKAIIETLKSAARFVWFGLLALIVVALTALVSDPSIIGAVVEVQGIKISLGVVLVAVIGYIIKLVDTYIHNNKQIKSNGLAPEFLQK